jgi:hypothetical protein
MTAYQRLQVRFALALVTLFGAPPALALVLRAPRATVVLTLLPLLFVLILHGTLVALRYWKRHGG